jgi:hypothetical protein
MFVIIGLGFLIPVGYIIPQGIPDRNTAITGVSIIVGIILILMGVTCCSMGWCYFIYVFSTARIRSLKRVVEEESKKYEAQHCRWRLKTPEDEPLPLSRTNLGMLKFHVN